MIRGSRGRQTEAQATVCVKPIITSCLFENLLWSVPKQISTRSTSNSLCKTNNYLFENLLWYTCVGEMGQVGEMDQETSYVFEMNFSLASNKLKKIASVKKCLQQKFEVLELMK